MVAEKILSKLTCEKHFTLFVLFDDTKHQSPLVRQQYIIVIQFLFHELVSNLVWYLLDSNESSSIAQGTLKIQNCFKKVFVKINKYIIKAITSLPKHL